MTTMCKTPKGTIAAFRWNNGIALGIYGKGNFISLEHDREKDELLILVNKSEMERQGFKLKFVGNDWRY